MVLMNIRSEQRSKLFDMAIETDCTDMQEVLAMAKKLSRNINYEYRFQEESLENIHLYEQTLIQYEQNNEFRDVL